MGESTGMFRERDVKSIVSSLICLVSDEPTLLHICLSIKLVLQLSAPGFLFSCSATPDELGLEKPP